MLNKIKSLISKDRIIVSSLTKDFLRSWLEWAVDNKGKSNPSTTYRPVQGLCISVYDWSAYRSDKQYVREEISLLFEACGLDPNFPFGIDSYAKHSEEGTQHECPKRLAWVRDALDDKLKPGWGSSPVNLLSKIINFARSRYVR